ncbi:hypothetical protein FB451DRAFT_1178982 [Mycena latifolia]|nr:hypothetical protein FB451DRAFT_1178982 [Mycena latifolia]
MFGFTANRARILPIFRIPSPSRAFTVAWDIFIYAGGAGPGVPELPVRSSHLLGSKRSKYFHESAVKMSALKAGAGARASNARPPALWFSMHPSENSYDYAAVSFLAKKLQSPPPVFARGLRFCRKPEAPLRCRLRTSRDRFLFSIVVWYPTARIVMWRFAQDLPAVGASASTSPPCEYDGFLFRSEGSLKIIQAPRRLLRVESGFTALRDTTSPDIPSNSKTQGRPGRNRA